MLFHLKIVKATKIKHQLFLCQLDLYSVMCAFYKQLQTNLLSADTGLHPHLVQNLNSVMHKPHTLWSNQHCTLRFQILSLLHLISHETRWVTGGHDLDKLELLAKLGGLLRWIGGPKVIHSWFKARLGNPWPSKCCWLHVFHAYLFKGQSNRIKWVLLPSKCIWLLP